MGLRSFGVKSGYSHRTTADTGADGVDVAEWLMKDEDYRSIAELRLRQQLKEEAYCH